MIDTLSLLAVGALGWGLALASYGLFARRLGWPMGALHVDFPALPVLVGVIGFAAGLAFAVDRGVDSQGGIVVLFGLMLAVFWVGFLRVGSQISLILAPIATVLLLVGWLGSPFDTQGAGSASNNLSLSDRSSEGRR